MFETPGRLLLGLAAGVAFGFLLQKGQVTKYRVIVGQFLLRDWTVFKVMLTAIVVGAIGIYAFKGLGWTSLHVKPANLGAILAGGAIFGVGMALLGACPGTGVGALAEGNRHVRWGVLGMLAGAALYAEVHGACSRTILQVWSLGKVTLPELTGLPAWLWIGLLGAGAAGAFWAIERWERRGKNSANPRRVSLAQNTRA